jgi:2,5-diamino-6-(ribosylamino)-4(3H)-pyrimidinone 5'-phosphate reductase
MDRPEVVVLNSASLDGRLAVSSDTLLLYGDERWKAMEAWSPNTESSSLFDQLKHTHSPQAMLEGSGSFVPEGETPEPLPPFEVDPESLYQDFLPEAVIGRPDLRGWFTIVDGRGRGRGWMKDGAAFGEEWIGWHMLILVGQHTPPEYLAYLQQEGIPYLVAGGHDGHVDLELAFEKMGGLLGVDCILSTAGGRLNGALLRAGLVDEINVEFFPAVIGGLGTPMMFDSPELKPDERPTQLELISCCAQTRGRVWLRYQVVRESGSSEE